VKSLFNKLFKIKDRIKKKRISNFGKERERIESSIKCHSKVEDEDQQ